MRADVAARMSRRRRRLDVHRGQRHRRPVHRQRQLGHVDVLRASATAPTTASPTRSPPATPPGTSSTSRTTGNYRVDAWWPANAGYNNSAPYIIATTSGNQTVNVDQRVTGGQWRTLGTFALAARRRQQGRREPLDLRHRLRHRRRRTAHPGLTPSCAVPLAAARRRARGRPARWSSPRPRPRRRRRHRRSSSASDFPDPDVIKVGGTYYAYSTNNGNGNVPVATATSLTGPWTRRGRTRCRRSARGRAAG